MVQTWANEDSELRCTMSDEGRFMRRVLVDTNECDSNDVYVRVGGRTYCVRVP